MGMNPLKRTVQLVANFAEGTDDGPEQWETQSRTSKLAEQLVLYKWLVLAGAFFIGAVTIFIVPVLPSAHRNWWTPALGLWLLSLAVVHIKSRGAGLRRLQDYHLNILFMGNTIVPRLGKRTGSLDEKTWGMKVLKQFKYGGLRTAFEQFRDRYSRKEISNHKEKYHRVSGDGTGNVVRGVLDNTTAEADACEYDITLFDGISVTHTAAEEDLLSDKHRETVTPLPPVIDDRMTAQVRGAFQSESHGRRVAERKTTELEDYVDDLEEYVDPSGQAIYENVMLMVKMLNKNTRRQNGQAEDDEIDLPERPPTMDDDTTGGY